MNHHRDIPLGPATGISADVRPSVGRGLSWALPAEGLVLDVRTRTLLVHEGELDEWGAGGGLRFDPDARGHGPAFGFRLAAGAEEGGAERLWKEGIASADDAARTEAWLEAEGSYGLPAPSVPGLLLTPWAGLGLEDEGSRSYSMGLRLDYGPDASLSLEGTRTESVDRRPGHDAMLKLEMRW